MPFPHFLSTHNNRFTAIMIMAATLPVPLQFRDCLSISDTSTNFAKLAEMSEEISFFAPYKHFCPAQICRWLF